MSLRLICWLFWCLVVHFVFISESEAALGVSADPCSPDPCWNGGVCAANGSAFICNCQHGFSGQKCQLRSTDCPVNSCVNGICRLDKAGAPQCFCTPGFAGKLCDINQDECASSPCKNGALCVDEVNGYKCVCKDDTYGHHCEIHQSEIQQCIARCDQEPCWRNYSFSVPVLWGYEESICSTKHSCFGGENDTEANVYDTFVEVQLMPLQIQVGDTLNFTADEEIVAYAGGFVPHHVVAADGAKAFLGCNESNGIPLVHKPTNSVVVDVDVLKLGINYFIANIDSTFRCDFGLRLNVSVKENNCKAPSSSEICSSRGQCTTNFTTPQYRCKCCGGFRGEFCEKVDYCFSKPCKNNATCQNMEGSADGTTHVCICLPGYEGRDCSRVTDMCVSVPCMNGGRCVPMVNNFTCHCPRGFTGRNCEVNINECASLPCMNGGTCLDGIGEFSCSCPMGFTGSHCEVDIDECSSSPCVYGTCIDQVNSFKCQCSPGYYGIKCDYNLDECLSSKGSNPCHNGGRCIDGVNSYQCDCGPGFKGTHCEIDIDLCKEPNMCVNSVSCTDKGQSVECVCQAGFTGYNCAVNINDCLSHPCMNGGTCRDKVNDFECICQEGFGGKTCNDMAGTIPSETFHQQLSLKLMTEDCKLLLAQGAVSVSRISQGVTSSIAEACNCSYSVANIVDGSVLLQCRDSISAEVSMEIKPVKGHSVNQLICQFHNLLIQHKNVIDLGYNTFAVRVLSDLSSCGHLKQQESVVKSDVKESDGVSSSRNLAVTVSLVCAAVGLIAAAVVVCLKCRRARPPIKRHSSKGENQMIEDLSADLLSAVAPTPKSMYRTSGGYHNVAFSGRFNPENPVKSRKV